MPNYTETSTPGDTRRRVYHLEIRNPDAGFPEVQLQTQDRINLLSGEREYVHRDTFIARFDADGLAESFDLVNVDTGEPLGQSMTGLQLMVAVQSWTLKQMLKRDAALAPVPEPEPVAPDNHATRNPRKADP